MISPLDWGLGHATRCIPIIHHLLERQHEVIIVASGGGFSLLQKEFPGLVILRCNSYKIRYARSGKLLKLELLRQLPGLLLAIRKEQQQTRAFCARYKPDLLISDNRFGFHCQGVLSVYITHQLQILTPKFTNNRIASRIHHSFIKKHKECWVPDTEDRTLSDKLSKETLAGICCKFIGPLSRFASTNSEKKNYKILVILSGPEPQRSILESILLEQLDGFQQNVCMVRGKPDDTIELHSPYPNLSIRNYVATVELQSLILQSELVISRSGYTTIMDLVKLRGKGVLIPTPGQIEQEYLAARCFEKKMFLVAHQEKFDLGEILKKAEDFPFELPEVDMKMYKKVIDESLAALTNH